MMKRYLRMFLLTAVGILLLHATGCHSSDDPAPATEAVYVPAAPDYADTRMWTMRLNDTVGTGADVFYIPSTWEYDWYTLDNRVSHHADPSRADHRANMYIEIDGVAEYMSDGNNFYSPFYRHITLDSWATLNEDTISRRYHDVAFPDVRRAFSRFLEVYNEGRPFILAGFSLGGKSVVELLKTLDDSTRRRMIAAYVLGYKVTPDDVAECPAIVAARDSADTGVVICYNS
ncbi:MAG: DUF3089 domain-containing protein, partial [Muribaculaceae bacterium]|nr:DUF3089 domain-containing protein [Muribaculaceae bacterium]